ncbi:MAG: hypothetical protein ACXACH_04865 [Candidatus Hermodarchaeia archaeon]
MKEVTCLDCNTIILVDDETYIGQNVTCLKCEAEFEIVDLTPIQIEWLYEDYDDADYDDDDYEEEYDDKYYEELEEAAR